jgi:hypothetical protein
VTFTKKMSEEKQLFYDSLWRLAEGGLQEQRAALLRALEDAHEARCMQCPQCQGSGRVMPDGSPASDSREVVSFFCATCTGHRHIARCLRRQFEMFGGSAPGESAYCLSGVILPRDEA